MKKLQTYIVLLLTVFLTVNLCSCSSDDDDNTPAVTASDIQGKWGNWTGVQFYATFSGNNLHFEIINYNDSYTGKHEVDAYGTYTINNGTLHFNITSNEANPDSEWFKVGEDHEFTVSWKDAKKTVLDIYPHGEFHRITSD